jgi:hypothetical protein
LSGQFAAVPGLVTLAIPNLTTGAGGVGDTNTDEDWVRAIRHGVGHDGRGLALMPSAVFYYLSDEDLGALIAYLKSLPPVDNEMPGTDLGPVGRISCRWTVTGRDCLGVTVIGQAFALVARAATVEYARTANTCTCRIPSQWADLTEVPMTMWRQPDARRRGKLDAGQFIAAMRAVYQAENLKAIKFFGR